MKSESDADAAFVIASLRRLVHGLRASSHGAERHAGVTGAQMMVLRQLTAEPGMSIRRLSERTLTDPSSVSVIVARLVEAGLVSRTRAREDGRRWVLAVSPRGQELVDRVPDLYQTRLLGALLDLPASRLRQLRSGLAALMEAPELQRPAAPLFFENHPSRVRESDQREKGKRTRRARN